MSKNNEETVLIHPICLRMENIGGQYATLATTVPPSRDQEKYKASGTTFAACKTQLFLKLSG